MPQNTILVSNRPDHKLIKNFITQVHMPMHIMPDLKQLHGHVATCATCVNLILIDHEVLCDSHIQLFDFMHMMHMLNTMYAHTHVKFTVLIDNQIKKDLLKNIMQTPHVSMMHVQDSHPETWRLVLEQIHAGIKHMPKHEVDRLLQSKSKSVVTTKNHVQPELTPRQKQVLNIICNSGASNKVIARSLKISESTVKLHISCILKKYGMTNRTQLALHAQKEATFK